MNKQIISIDSGKHSTKVVSHKDNYNLVKSIFRTRAMPNDGNLEPMGNTHSVEFQNKKYLIGDQGESFSTELSKATEIHSISAYCGITQVLNDEIGQAVKLVYGCPVNIYKNKDYRDECKNKLLQNKEIYIVVDGKEYLFEIENVALMPEGSGVVYLFPSLFAGQRVAVIDIGGLNMNFTIYNKMVPEIDSMLTDNLGSYYLLNQIKKEISSKYNRVISQNDAESILSNGYIKIKGSIEEQSVKIVNDILDEYMNSIKKFIINNNHDIDTIDVVISGGTALIISDALKKHIPHARILENTQWHNALGFLKVGEYQYEKQSK